ncbi:SDR family NAD(P)-dependent oxidoreductase [Pseudomonas sp. N040]|uniref:SDR family NAD(P)-dependent oxidoreductase n=1 Tax=Pseudomonas sp. N040 TaxID=2785325 RepID=UPI0018A29148|nr:SDR family NAD(P)-dependent oxidoreductase [Pseudomonas sp. N040]MBF7730131.1 SDR family NAD(P)-dependent oxidoreductase [Pseudomonas sp. N040]MBW7013773.1 SDR family NAD(P)-dependent oxidoreductase [Pseudomonas sp. N040]
MPTSLAQNSTPPIHVLVAGASRGIGLALCAQLLARKEVGQLWALARHSDTPELAELGRQHAGRLQTISLDALDEAALAVFSGELQARGIKLSLLVSCIGLLQGEGARAEKSLSQVSLESLHASFQHNAFAPLLLLKHCLPLLRGNHPCQIAMLSARVGSIGDNRLGGWYSYRASKAALNQLLRCASIELARLNPQSCVLSLHPGTTDTALSRPFQANVAADKLFSPAFAASQLLLVLAGKTPADSGSFWSWDGQPIEW